MTNSDVHIYGPSFSNFVRSVMLVCEEKNISYTVGFEVNGENVDFKSDQHFSLHPFGKLPVLIHNELVLPETASICRYLDRTFSGSSLQPQNPIAYAQHDALCALISIDVDKALVRDYLLEFAFPKGEQGAIRFDVVKAAQQQLRKALAFVSQQVEAQIIISGEEFSIADALLAPMLHYLMGLPKGYNLLEEFPILVHYLAKLMQRPSCQKVLVAK